MWTVITGAESYRSASLAFTSLGYITLACSFPSNIGNQVKNCKLALNKGLINEIMRRNSCLLFKPFYSVSINTKLLLNIIQPF